ncbi:MAG: glycosyltransferase, partial [Caldilineae bacterium]
MSFSVYFISGCKAGTTFEYRILQKQEQLAAHGIHSVARQDLTGGERLLLREVAAHDILYLYRIAYSPLLESLIAQARALGIPVIFGTDDLVFEPEEVRHVDPVRAMGDEEAALYYEGVWRYRRTLLASDAVITSTGYLADRARTLGKPAFVHRNGLSGWMITEADKRMQQSPARPADGKIIIGYGSGTATHRKDLAEAAEGLARVLARHPHVELHIVGALHPGDDPALPDELRPFAGRIRHRPAVPWRDWLAVQRTFDINLAPLEAGNPFCDAKSEIKYTEAAIVGVPTVASRTAAFEFAIRDGETGFLAGNTDEWAAKLEALVTDASLRRRMGEAARADVLARYAPETMGQQLVETLSAIRALRRPQIHPASNPAPDETPLILNWIFPEPMPGSGGHTDIIRMMNLLAGFGHRVNAYIVPRQRLWDKSDLEVRQFVHRHFAPLNGGVFKWNEGPMV